MPERIQLRRTKGWRKPDNAIIVAKPSPYGNPFPWSGNWICWAAVAIGHKANETGRRHAAVAFHRSWLTGEPIAVDTTGDEATGALIFDDGTERTIAAHVRGLAFIAAALMGTGPELPERPDLTPLRGHDLACWCPVDAPCHADTLLELVNREEE